MAFIVTAGQLRAISGARAPHCEEIADAFNSSASKFGLDSPLRAAHFFAQISHESGGFRYVREIWGPTRAQLEYEGRRDLGNTVAGDGKRFMGRGLIQITGRANAHTFTKWTKEHFNNAPDFEANPVEMERFPWALVGAFWYWATRNLNAIADRDNIDAVTKKINGGLNGIADRRLRLALARKAFEGGALTPMAPTPREDEAGRKTVRRGAKGDIVKALQRALGIADDGQFGLATEAAVLEFQREHGLIPDGIVGPASWRALDGLK